MSLIGTRKLGERYDISAERARQIEAAAIRQLHEFVVTRLGSEYGTARLACRASKAR